MRKSLIAVPIVSLHNTVFHIFMHIIPISFLYPAFIICLLATPKWTSTTLLNSLDFYQLPAQTSYERIKQAYSETEYIAPLQNQSFTTTP